ncbi:MAG: hypothetical protein ACE5IR_26125 [bacterium]
MQISEPTTMLTDYILALFTLLLCGHLFKLNSPDRQVSVQLWNFAFIATAIAAFLGGASHGFADYFNAFFSAALWKGTVYAIGFASFFMLAGSIIAAVTNPGRRWLLALTTLKLFFYAIWMITHSDFSYVIYDYVPAMLGVFMLQVYSYRNKKTKSAVWITSGIIVSFFGSGIQMSGFTIHEYFNHNDLYHVVQMGAIYLMYRGVCLLKDCQIVSDRKLRNKL